MGYRTHAALTVLATFVGLFAGGAVGIFLGIHFLTRGNLWPFPLLCIGGITIGFLSPTWLMQQIPVRCAKCAERARLRLVAWKFKNSFVPSPVYAYRCESCKWSTYRGNR